MGDFIKPWHVFPQINKSSVRRTARQAGAKFQRNSVPEPEVGREIPSSSLPLWSRSMGGGERGGGEEQTACQKMKAGFRWDRVPGGLTDWSVSRERPRRDAGEDKEGSARAAGRNRGMIHPPSIRCVWNVLGSGTGELFTFTHRSHRHINRWSADHT